MGVSGGVDSSYALVKAKEYGLRILAVHCDTGWNSDIAVSNIKNLVDYLDIDLETVVVDWRVMRSLQRSFFFSFSV
ncbi:7-cyano-7-deazaguanine synthase [Nitrincola sp. A-D6]|uniref:7-cyano-7-deazaguanine synthase n=1 Tax=Nitrincola sp. A-D6 TaxID=1545442 RepID=UPI001F3811AC|nr:7-cyano-7-deazaguanine synthase [Nitrincola sp. A-D6]